MAEKDGPVYLLSLDGGGVRGICELIILDKIMKRVQTELGLASIPKPCDHFHLIGGVSTGGLVAIMLGRLGMTTTDAIAAYHDFAENIFGWRNRRIKFVTPRGPDLVEGTKVAQGKFGTEKLEKIIQNLVKKTGNSEGMLDEEPKALARAFVCTQRHDDTGAASLVMLRGYKLPGKPLSQGFLEQIHEASTPADSTQSLLENVQPPKPEDLQPIEDYTSCKVWEAARATSAASGFFRPMEIKDSRGQSKLFIDAALGCNNPVKYVCTEAAALFGVERKLGCVLSLGTGLVGTGLISTESGSLVNIVKAVVKHATTSETTNKEVQAYFGKDTDAYFRLNLPMEKKVKLSDWKAVSDLAKDTATYLEDREPSAIVNHVVDILLGKHKPKLRLGQVAFSDQGQFRPKKPVTGRPATTAHFVGRKDVISRLAQVLATPGPTRASALIWANGGAGKTTAASRFLDEHDDKFDKIFWVDATDENTLAAGYALIAEEEQLPASGGNLTGIVLNHIAACPGHWLLVVDNVMGNVNSYLPPGNRGSLLFTSRSKDTSSVPVKSSDIIELGNLGVDEAVTLLLDMAGMDQASRKNKADALQIVTTQLAYLPLAIEQAATHIQKQKITLAVYASRFEEQRMSLLSRGRRPLDSKTAHADADADTAVLPGTQAVHISFDLTYDVLVDAAHGDTPEAHEAKNALRVLSAFSFYANEGLIPDIFKRAAERRPDRRSTEHLGGKTLLSLEPLLLVNEDSKQWDIDAFSSGILCLIQWSLVKVNDKGNVFSMHLLTHDWARERSSDRERLVRAAAARHILFDAYAWQNSETRDWIFNRKLMPHMRACFENTAAFADHEPLLDACHRSRYAEMLMHEDRPHEAIHMLELPLATFEKSEKIFSWEYWHMLGTVAKSMLGVGMLDEAERMTKHISRLQDIMIDAGEFKPSSIIVINTQVMLADILAQRGGHWPEAEARLLEIINFGVAENGEGHWLTNWLSVLQSKYTLHCQFEDAYHVSRRNHDLCRRIYEPGHKNAIDATRNLARTCVQSGRLADAEDLALEVLRVEEALIDAGLHVQTLNKTRVLLADVLLGQERYEEAYERFQQLVAVLRLEPASSAHEDLPGAYQGLAEAALFLGHWEEGLDYGRVAFMFLYEHLGAKSKKTRQACATVLMWLAQAREVGFVVNGSRWDDFWRVAPDVESWESGTG